MIYYFIQNKIIIKKNVLSKMTFKLILTLVIMMECNMNHLIILLQIKNIIQIETILQIETLL